jgi:hypothetical protein
MTKLAIMASLAGLAALLAVGQVSPQERGKLSKAEIDRNLKEEGDKARGDAMALIAAAGAQGVFEAQGPATSPIVLHKPSGLRCHFDGNPEVGLSQDVLAILDIPGPPGDNVACGRRFGGVGAIMFINKAPKAMAIGEAFADAEADLKTLYPTAAAWPTVPKPLLPLPTKAPYKVAFYGVTQNGVKGYVRLSVALIDGWIVTHRVTAAEAQAAMVDLSGEIWFNAAIRERFTPAADVARKDLYDLQQQAASRVPRAANGAKHGTIEWADRDGDGVLSRAESIASMRAGSSRINVDVENRWFDRRDEDKSCTLDRREYTMSIPTIDLTKPLPEQYQPKPDCAPKPAG